MGTHASFYRPNMLVVLTDDHHHAAFGAAGNTEVRTPTMDRLAREGARLTGCHVSSPVSTVSRASLLTGQFGFRNGCATSGQSIAQDAPRLAELLSRYGYSTALVGKWHNDQRPVHHGFDYMRNVFCGGMHDYASIPVVQHAEDRPKELRGNPTEIFTDGALGLLQGGLQEPYALFVCYTAPHDPRTPRRNMRRCTRLGPCHSRRTSGLNPSSTRACWPTATRPSCRAPSIQTRSGKNGRATMALSHTWTVNSPESLSNWRARANWTGPRCS